MKFHKKPNVKKELLKYFTKKGFKINEKKNLIENNILDSMGMFDLISFLEKKFKIKLSPAQINAENFKNIEVILKKIFKLKK